MGDVSDGDPERDIGRYSSYRDVPPGSEVASDEQLELEKLHGVIGNEQVNRNGLECAPHWLVERALSDEIEKDWSEAYEEVHEFDVPQGEKIITSHEVKCEERDTKRLKGRLCPHGNLVK